MASSGHIGFPVPLLGMEPVRLPILLDDGEHLVLAKPHGILVQADIWYPRLPVLIEAIRHQARLAKPELVRLNIGGEGLWAVSDLDPELHGPVLFTRTRERAEELRNLMGSGGFVFTFVLLTRSESALSPVECELPLARHARNPRMLVSHTTGKKAHTTLERETACGPCQLWRATASFPRRHQILLHALESGLPVVGDTLYARDRPILLSDLKRHYTIKPDLEERPLYDGPACYLKRLDFGAGPAVECPEPPRWGGLIKQLQKHSQA